MLPLVEPLLGQPYISRLALGQSSENDPEENKKLADMDVTDAEDVLCAASPFLLMRDGLHPFEDKTRKHAPRQFGEFGVIVIKNIPYNVTKSEILHFLGRSTPLINAHTDGCPIHIIMERPTSKTMDCYVEFLTQNDAEDAFKRHENLVMSGKPPKLGTRHVNVEVSNQDELMQNLFPRARGLVWKDGVPERVGNADAYSGGFRGFFTKEEMVGMVRHAETPQRSPFSIKCLQRTYECMISTLYKFPWPSTDMYSLEDVNILFTVYLEQLHVLATKVAEGRTVGLDQKLMLDFLLSGMNCPGFGERMKAAIRDVAGAWGKGIGARSDASWELSRRWPFELLSRPQLGPGKIWWNDEVVKFYLLLLDLGVLALKPLPLFAHAIEFLLDGPDPYNLHNIRFCFVQSVQNWKYAAALDLEFDLLQTLITAGYQRWKDEVRDDQLSSGLDIPLPLKQDIRMLSDLLHLQINHAEETRMAAQIEQWQARNEMANRAEENGESQAAGEDGGVLWPEATEPNTPNYGQYYLGNDNAGNNGGSGGHVHISPSSAVSVQQQNSLAVNAQAGPSARRMPDTFTTPVRQRQGQSKPISPFTPRSAVGAAADDSPSNDRRYSEPRYMQAYTNNVDISAGPSRPLLSLDENSSPVYRRASSSAALEIRQPDTGTSRSEAKEKAMASLNDNSTIDQASSGGMSKMKPISPPKLSRTSVNNGNGNGKGKASQRVTFTAPSTIEEEDDEEHVDAKNEETFGPGALVAGRADRAADEEEDEDEDEVLLRRVGGIGELRIE